MSLKTERIKQPTVNTVVQPLKIGGVLEDGSDAKIAVSTTGVVTVNNKDVASTGKAIAMAIVFGG